MSKNATEVAATAIVLSVLLILLAAVFSFFTAWVLMVGLGNVGVHVSYWGSIPLAFLINWKFSTSIKNG